MARRKENETRLYLYEIAIGGGPGPLSAKTRKSVTILFSGKGPRCLSQEGGCCPEEITSYKLKVQDEKRVCTTAEKGEGSNVLGEVEGKEKGNFTYSGGKKRLSPLQREVSSLVSLRGRTSLEPKKTSLTIRTNCVRTAGTRGPPTGRQAKEKAFSLLGAYLDDAKVTLLPKVGVFTEGSPFFRDKLAKK